MFSKFQIKLSLATALVLPLVPLTAFAQTEVQTESDREIVAAHELEAASNDTQFKNISYVFLNSAGVIRDRYSIETATGKSFETHFKFDPNGHILRIDYPTSWKTFTNDAHGNVLQESNSNGSLIVRRFDEQNRQTYWFSSYPGRSAVHSITTYSDLPGGASQAVETRSDSLVTTRRFDARGLEIYYLHVTPTRTYGPIKKQYSVLGKLVRTEQANGDVSVLGYDASGNLISTTRNGVLDTRIYYDNLNRETIYAAKSFLKQTNYDDVALTSTAVSRFFQNDGSLSEVFTLNTGFDPQKRKQYEEFLFTEYSSLTLYFYDK